MLRLNATNVDEARRLVRAHSGGRVRRVVDDLLDELDVPDDQMARINAHRARLLADDDVLREIRLE